jgi:hypothetical protein
VLENKNNPQGGGKAVLFHSNVSALVLTTKYANITSNKKIEEDLYDYTSTGIGNVLGNEERSVRFK